MKYKHQRLIRTAAILLLVITTAMSCENGKREDSKEVAEEQNEEKFDNRADEQDAKFVVDAVASNYSEIRLAKYAMQRSSNSEVKSIAQTLVDDHTAMLSNLKSLAASKSISIPNEDSAEVAKRIDDYDDKTPENFDKEWTQDMIDKHKSTIDKMENVQKNSKDADLRSLVDGALPKVRSHLDMLNACHDKLK